MFEAEIYRMAGHVDFRSCRDSNHVQDIINKRWIAFWTRYEEDFERHISAYPIVKDTLPNPFFIKLSIEKFKEICKCGVDHSPLDHPEELPEPLKRIL